PRLPRRPAAARRRAGRGGRGGRLARGHRAARPRPSRRAGAGAPCRLRRPAGRPRRAARRAPPRPAVPAAAAGAACWWLGRTESPCCAPDSLLQPHAAWHLLGAAALGAWAWATLARDQTL